MKKYAFILMVLIFTLSSLFAHPANSVDLTFDKATSILKVNFTHKVGDETAHFIYDVEVKLNGKKLINQETLRQDTKEGGYYLFKIVDAKVNDKISVMVDCNKGGKKTETLVIK